MTLRPCDLYQQKKMDHSREDERFITACISAPITATVIAVYVPLALMWYGVKYTWYGVKHTVKYAKKSHARRVARAEERRQNREANFTVPADDHITDAQTL